MNQLSKLLTHYNGIIKENDQLYRKVTKALGLSDSAFWILYALRETEGRRTEKDIVSISLLPPQTINSALKKLEAEGYVALLSGSDKRKKEVLLTEKGKALAAQTADKVIAIELQTMGSLTEQEQDAFLGLLRKYTDLLKENLSILDEKNFSILDKERV